MNFEFLPTEFAACSKPPSRDNCKVSYPKTQEHDQGGVKPRSSDQDRQKTMLLPIRPHFHLNMLCAVAGQEMGNYIVKCKRAEFWQKTT